MQDKTSDRDNLYLKSLIANYEKARDELSNFLVQQFHVGDVVWFHVLDSRIQAIVHGYCTDPCVIAMLFESGNVWAKDVLRISSSEKCEWQPWVIRKKRSDAAFKAAATRRNKNRS